MAENQSLKSRVAVDLQALRGKIQTLPPNQVLALGAGALLVGYVIGSGRWSSVKSSSGKIIGTLGSVAARYLVAAVRERGINISFPS